MGAMVALYHREMASGKGQHVDVSVQEGPISGLLMAVELYDLLGVNVPRISGYWAAARRDPGAPPLLMRWHYPCKDGYVTWQFQGGPLGGLVQSTKAMTEMANRHGRAMELQDYDWTQLDASTIPQEEYNRLVDIFVDFFKTQTKAALYREALDKDILLAPVNTSKDLLEDNQLEDRGFWVKVEHPELGDVITYPGPFLQLSEAPWRVWRRPPLIGEHNEEIFVNELNLKLVACKMT